VHATTNRLIQPGSPFELQDAMVHGVPCKVFCKGPATLQAIYRKAALVPNREYLVCGGTSLTMGTTLEQASALGRALGRLAGVHAGTRVGLVMSNCTEWVVAFVAITSIGATAVLMNPGSSQEEIARSTRQHGCAVIVCDQEHAEAVAAVGAERMIVCNAADAQTASRGWTSFEALIQWGRTSAAETSTYFAASDPDSLALIALTSGTTGSPKGVELTHRNITTGVMNMLLGAAITSLRRGPGKAPGKSALPSAAPCTLLMAPLSYVGGYAQLLLMMHLAGKAVLLPRRDLQEAARVIAQQQVRSLSGATPADLADLIRMSRDHRGLESLSAFYIHGGDLHAGLVSQLRDAFPGATISTGYGLTETCGSICVAAEAELQQHPGSCGQVLPSAELRLVGDELADVLPGERGEILIRGAMVGARSSTDAGEISRAVSGGWLETGDIGRLDSEGYLYVVDRRDGVVVVGGKQISSADVERTAASHPQVEQTAALGVSGSGSAEELLLAVTLRDNSALDVQSLRRHVQHKLVDPQLRLRVLICERFPRTVSGKVDRRCLREQLLGAGTA